MAEIVKKENVIKKKKAPVKPASVRTKTMFAIGIVIILIPFVIVAVIVLGDVFSGRKPIVKNRYTNDLNPAIAKEKMDAINSDVSKLSGVENVNVDLKTSTLRIYVDIKDSATDEETEKIAKDAYLAVTSSLPANTYFTGSASSKMYDLEIHVYTVTEKEDSNFNYYILTRNSNTEQEDGYILEHVSVAKDPELAAALRGEVTEEATGEYDNPVDDTVENAEETAE